MNRKDSSYINTIPIADVLENHNRLVSTIRTGDYYLVGDDFDSCASSSYLFRAHVADATALDLEANKIVDESYLDRTSWIKKCIRTGNLKLPSHPHEVLILYILTSRPHGQVQQRPCYHAICRRGKPSIFSRSSMDANIWLG